MGFILIRDKAQTVFRWSTVLGSCGGRKGRRSVSRAVSASTSVRSSAHDQQGSNRRLGDSIFKFVERFTYLGIFTLLYIT